MDVGGTATKERHAYIRTSIPYAVVAEVAERPYCLKGYRDSTGGSAYWRKSGKDCIGGKFWVDNDNNCACQCGGMDGFELKKGQICRSGEKLDASGREYEDLVVSLSGCHKFCQQDSKCNSFGLEDQYTCTFWKGCSTLEPASELAANKCFYEKIPEPIVGFDPMPGKKCSGAVGDIESWNQPGGMRGYKEDPQGCAGWCKTFTGSPACVFFNIGEFTDDECEFFSESGCGTVQDAGDQHRILYKKAAGEMVVDYEFEIKAWVPQEKSPDPERMGVFGRRRAFWNAFFDDDHHDDWHHWFGSNDVYYEGDNHDDYEGSYRALVEAHFTWDGEKILDFWSDADLGTTTQHQVNKWTGRDNVRSEPVEGEAHGKQLGEDKVKLTLSARNSIMDVSPHMDFSVEFTISDKGIQVEYTSDQYPSYGIRITQDDNEISTIIVKDAKGASANDFSTTMNMVSNTNYGSYFVPNAESEVGVQNNKSRSLAFSFVEEKPVVAGFAIVGVLAILRFATLSCTKKSEYSVVA